VIARRLTAAVPAVMVAVVVLATASSAAGSAVRTCTSRSGSTQLENRYVRVFTHHGDTYACARGSTGVTTLASAEHVKLAGRYVGWQEIPNGQYDGLNVLDTATGRYETVGDALNGSDLAVEAIGGYVLNAGGTVVWIFDSTICGPSGADCNGAGYVFEHSYLGRTTLASATGSGGAHAFTRLAISADGTIAYWLEYGELEGALLY
jgi:hypothetical protein